MATVEAFPVTRTWARDPAGELVLVRGTKRSGMSMDFIIEKDAAEALMKSIWDILNPVEFTTDEFGTGQIAFKRQIGGGAVFDIECTDYAFPTHENHSHRETTHFVHCNGAAHFVKEADFFRSQGGDKAEWGKNWRPVVAASIEDARALSAAMDWSKA